MAPTVEQRTEWRVKAGDCQPSKAELETEVGMPGANMSTLRDAFFKPTKQEYREAA